MGWQGFPLSFQIHMGSSAVQLSGFFSSAHPPECDRFNMKFGHPFWTQTKQHMGNQNKGGYGLGFALWHPGEPQTCWCSWVLTPGLRMVHGLVEPPRIQKLSPGLISGTIPISTVAATGHMGLCSVLCCTGWAVASSLLLLRVWWSLCHHPSHLSACQIHKKNQRDPETWTSWLLTRHFWIDSHVSLFSITFPCAEKRLCVNWTPPSGDCSVSPPRLHLFETWPAGSPYAPNAKIFVNLSERSCGEPWPETWNVLDMILP